MILLFSTLILGILYKLQASFLINCHYFLWNHKIKFLNLDILFNKTKQQNQGNKSYCPIIDFDSGRRDQYKVLSVKQNEGEPTFPYSVSYTHLTLPTILLV